MYLFSFLPSDDFLSHLVSQGPIPSSSLLVLLEFHQLNLLPDQLSLSELLFQHYLPPGGGDDEKVHGMMMSLMGNTT